MAEKQATHSLAMAALRAQIDRLTAAQSQASASASASESKAIESAAAIAEELRSQKAALQTQFDALTAEKAQLTQRSALSPSPQLIS
jgi:hypothetical protein